MDNEKIYNLMEKLYSEMQKGFEKVDARFEQIDARFEQVDARMDSLEKEVKKTNFVIEHDIKPKIEILFDGHKQLSDKLDRIEAEVIKHDEFIMKRIK